MRIGIAGYGAIAADHARALQRAGAVVAAVAGPNRSSASAFAETHRIERVARDVEELVSDPDIDGVVVASPNALHVDQTEAALDGGKHVLCEVPMAMSPAEAVRITERASRSDRRVMVCQTQRFLEPMQTMADWASGLKINHVVVRLVLNRTDNVGITGRLRTWTDDLVWHHGSHAVDTALWLLGEPAVDVSAVGVGMSTARTPMDVGILLRTGSGGLATIALSYTAHRPSTDLLVICDGETFRYERGLLTASDGRSCAYDEGRLFEDAVDRQDALFVESGDVTPTPAELARTYDALGRVAAALGAATR